MPPSPALRCSPGRELRGNNHRGVRSLEGTVLYREKEDDLALFNEMEMRERDNFLLQSNDDFEGILSSKLRNFSSDEHGVSFPARGENSYLLNADEKNDYDWLITPPDASLFHSSDDETPAITVARSGRPRSKSVTISRSSTMEKSYMSSRGSANPNRLSPSPNSINSGIQSRGRPSPRSSPTSSLYGTTSSRGPSPPPKKPSTPVPRSSTPTSWRMSVVTGGNTSSFGKRGASPVNKARGNSASPKAKAWQKNIPSFSLGASPNRRTSLEDQSTSYVRGSSPASPNGRLSMSPTASRSASSSYGRDRDSFSTYSKRCITSACDDDADSLQSIPMKSFDHSASRRGGAYTSNHAPALLRKSNWPGLSSSAPKRSLDSALRRVDHRHQSPQNMFRPLLSRAPNSTFYVGKSTSIYHSLISRNSLVTTSSNTSSDPDSTGGYNAEGNDDNQDTASTYTYGEALYVNVEDDVFVPEKMDPVSEGVGQVAINGGARISSQVGGPIEFLETTATAEILETKGKFLELNNSVEGRVICSECGYNYPAMGSTERELNLCPDCRSEWPLAATSPVPAVTVSEVYKSPSMKNLDDYASFDAEERLASALGSSGLTDAEETSAFQCDKNVDENHIPSADPSLNLSTHNSVGQKVSWEQVINQPTTSHNGSYDGDNQPMQHLSEFPNLRLDVSERTGISVLLKRSSSGKGPFVQISSFTATSISFDDLSYVRDCPPSMRSSTSSLDISMRHCRSGSSLSGSSSQAYHGLGISNNEIIVVDDETEAGIRNARPKEQSLASERARFDNDLSKVIYHDRRGTVVTDALDAADLAASSNISFLNFDDSGLYGNGEDEQCDTRSINFDDSGLYGNGEDEQCDTRSISDGKDGMEVSCDSDVADLVEIPTHGQLETITEIEVENGHLGSPDSQSEVGSSGSSHNLDELQETSVSTRNEKDVVTSVAERDISDHARGCFEESTVTVQFGAKAKILALEEAADVILFCRSIVHNLAYEAAALAIEKENLVPLEGSCPSVTILGNSNSYNIEESAERTPKSQETRRRQVETETETKTKIPSGKDWGHSTYEKSTTRIVGFPDRGDSLKPPKIESKCNCTIM